MARREPGLDAIAELTGRTRAQVRRALQTEGGDLAAALRRLGVPSELAAEALALGTGGLSLGDAIVSAGESLAPRRRRSTEPVPPDLLTRAFYPRGRPGRLTRRNTEPGTPERRAVDRAMYLGRQEQAARHARARGEPPPTARRAVGHHRPGERRRLPAWLEDPPRYVVVEVNLPDSRLIGRHDALVRVFLYGQLSPSGFRRRARRIRLINVLDPADERGERRLLSDPNALLALSEQVRAEEDGIPFSYEVIAP